MKETLRVAYEAHQKQMTKVHEENAKAGELWTLVKQLCDHPYTERKVEYCPGGYLDRETWDTYKVCTICKHREHIKHETGGYG